MYDQSDGQVGIRCACRTKGISDHYRTDPFDVDTLNQSPRHTPRPARSAHGQHNQAKIHECSWTVQTHRYDATVSSSCQGVAMQLLGCSGS